MHEDAPNRIESVHLSVISWILSGRIEIVDAGLERASLRQYPHQDCRTQYDSTHGPTSSPPVAGLAPFAHSSAVIGRPPVKLVHRHNGVYTNPQGMHHQPSKSERTVYGSPLIQPRCPGRSRTTVLGRRKLMKTSEIQYSKKTRRSPATESGRGRLSCPGCRMIRSSCRVFEGSTLSCSLRRFIVAKIAASGVALAPRGGFSGR